MTWLRMATCAALQLAFAAGPADAADTFVLQNRGEHTIVRVYWVPVVLQLLTGANDWGTNILSSGIAPGTDTTFTFSSGGTPRQCNVNIKLIYRDGSSKVVPAIDSCKTRRLVSEY